MNTKPVDSILEGSFKSKSDEQESFSSSQNISDESHAGPLIYKQCLSCFSNFILRNFLPVCLISYVVFGAVFPAPGVFMGSLPTSYVAIVFIFLINGLKLKTQELTSALKQYKAIICAFICIFVLAPIIATKLTELLPYGEVSTKRMDRKVSAENGNETDVLQGYVSNILGPGEIRLGFQVHFLMPCTLITCIVMVTQLGGDPILATLISVSTNIAAVFLVPFMMTWLTSFETEVKLDIGKILLKLVLTVLLPLVVGKILRFIGPLQRTVDKHKKAVSIMSVAVLCLVPWMKVSQTSANNTLGLLSVPGVFICIGWGSFIHILFILQAILLVLTFRLEIKYSKTVIITSSQKTVSLYLTVISLLPEEVGDQGLMSVPGIISHLSIVVIDSLIISRAVEYEKRKTREEIVLKDDSYDNEEKEIEISYETGL